MHTEYDIRMKEYYEKRSRTYLTRRTPVIARIDGKGFSKFCKRFEKPYDQFFNNTMANVMKFICQNCQGIKFAERHSDEMSFLFTDFETLQTDAFFDYNTQKMCSIMGSMATAEFCRLLVPIVDISEFDDLGNEKRILDWEEKWPTFDCRVFNIPKEEVTNYFWWRMSDGKRGSINMHAQANFSHKSLQGLSCDQMQEKLWQEKNINWGKLSQRIKIGDICIREQVEKPIPAGPQKGEMVTRNVWAIKGSPKTRDELDEIIEPLLNPEVIS